jgi:mono/diheme cytochrome c family protein
MRRLLLALAVCGCDPIPSPNLERMIRQENDRPYAETPFFADRRVLRIPPEGTVPTDRVLGNPLLRDGAADGRYADRVPLPVDRTLLVRGRDRFDIYCAVCHGTRGDGVSDVAVRMELRKPPSLTDAVARAFPPGRVYQAIAKGYGVMPSYAAALPLYDRWAIVGYLRALQLSQDVALAKLPPALRREAEEALR